MSSPTILVTGATGTVGSALVPALLQRGVPVRAMTRSATRSIPGAETVVADLRDESAVVTAMHDIDVAFLNSPSSEDAAQTQIRFLDLAARTGVSRVVLLSQYSARADSPVRFLRWHAEVESHLRRLGIAGTVLRPNLYLQSFLGFAETIAQGVLAAPIGDAAVSAVDTRDVADAAATVLTATGHDGQTYTLTGPRPLTHREIAEAIGDAIGSPVVFHELTSGQFAAALETYMPRWQVDGLIEDYAHYARGEAADVTTAITDLTGRPARDASDFARDHTAAFARL